MFLVVATILSIYIVSRPFSIQLGLVRQALNGDEGTFERLKSVHKKWETELEEEKKERKKEKEEKKRGQKSTFGSRKSRPVVVNRTNFWASVGRKKSAAVDHNERINV